MLAGRGVGGQGRWSNGVIREGGERGRCEPVESSSWCVYGEEDFAPCQAQRQSLVPHWF